MSLIDYLEGTRNSALTEAKHLLDASNVPLPMSTTIEVESHLADADRAQRLLRVLRHEASES